MGWVGLGIPPILDRQFYYMLEIERKRYFKKFYATDIPEIIVKYQIYLFILIFKPSMKHVQVGA